MLTPSKVLFNLNKILIHIWIVSLDIIQNVNFNLSLFTIFLAITHYLNSYLFVLFVINTFKYLTEGTLTQHTSDLITICYVIFLSPQISTTMFTIMSTLYRRRWARRLRMYRFLWEVGAQRYSPPWSNKFPYAGEFQPIVRKFSCVNRTS
jgi:hypothetical protein